jgi:hypothetical protein
VQPCEIAHRTKSFVVDDDLVRDALVEIAALRLAYDREGGAAAALDWYSERST